MSFWDNDDLEYTDNELLEDDEESEADLIKKVDPELIDYFNDAIITRSNYRSRKPKKEKLVFNIGDTVLYNSQKYSVLYGPYDNNNKTFYELESLKGNVVSVEDKFIEKI